MRILLLILLLDQARVYTAPGWFVCFCVAGWILRGIVGMLRTEANQQLTDPYKKLPYLTYLDLPPGT